MLFYIGIIPIIYFAIVDMNYVILHGFLVIVTLFYVGLSPLSILYFSRGYFKPRLFMFGLLS